MKKLIYLILLVSFGLCADPVLTRLQPATGQYNTDPFIHGDSCGKDGKGRKVSVENSSTPNVSLSYVICERTYGRNSRVSNYVLNGRPTLNTPKTKTYVGCTVSDDGVATGFEVLWFSFGTYTPSDITNASQAAVIESNGSGKSRILMNYHTKKDMLVDFVRANGTKISNIVVPKSTNEDAPPTVVPAGSRVFNVRYSFPYTGGEIPCNY
nr:hypothetical protein [uncultured Pantoea sp.]